MAKRNTDYQFIDTDTSTLESYMIAAYETITGVTVYPASPERVFIAWVTNIILQERILTNYTGNQNIPSRATGTNLDALAELFYADARPDAKKAKCTMRFYISEAQNTTILVPKGTRVTNKSGTVVWETTEDALVEIGETFVDTAAECQTAGTEGNGYEPGQISTAVDLYDYYLKCENITVSDGGANRADDDEYYEILRASMDAYSTAGPAGAYEYHAKSVSTKIADVAAVRLAAPESKTVTVYRPSGDAAFAFISGNELLAAYPANGEKACAFIGGDISIDVDSVVVYPHGGTQAAELGTDYELSYIDSILTISIKPEGMLAAESKLDCSYNRISAGKVTIYVLMDDGNAAGEEIKNAVLQACSEDTVRPLTDTVDVQDPEYVEYDIDITYYLKPENGTGVAGITAEVEQAVEDFVKWQCGKLGRDINPSYLISEVMRAGIKRVDVRKPKFTHMNDGSQNDVPQLAKIRNIKIVNGGIEEE